MEMTVRHFGGAADRLARNYFNGKRTLVCLFRGVPEKQPEEEQVEMGSGNVFRDLGLISDAAALDVLDGLGVEINGRNLKIVSDIIDKTIERARDER
jgi:hypothetical protein